MSLAQQAKELYALCDPTNLGYISRSELSRLQEYLPLTDDQLDDVFSRLDNNGDGRLTLSEFTKGFGNFIGESNSELLLEDQPNSDTDELFKQTLTQTGADGVVEDVDTVREVWEQLRRENPLILPEFERLLSRIAKEMKTTRSEYQNLENALRIRSTAHDEEVRHLYEEMESQLKQERERLVFQEREKERQLRLELEAEIQEKDRLAQEIIQQHEETQRRLDELTQSHAETAQEKEQLATERAELEKRLADSEISLEECQEYIETLHRKSKEDKLKRAQAAIELSEGIALERESLVKQLISLREINKKLKDEQDEKLLRRSIYLSKDDLAGEHCLSDIPLYGGQQRPSATGSLVTTGSSEEDCGSGNGGGIGAYDGVRDQMDRDRSGCDGVDNTELMENKTGYDAKKERKMSRRKTGGIGGNGHIKRKLGLKKSEIDARRGSTLGNYFNTSPRQLQYFGDFNDNITELETEGVFNSHSGQKNHYGRTQRLPSIVLDDAFAEEPIIAQVANHVSGATTLIRRQSSSLHRPSPDGAIDQETHVETRMVLNEPQHVYKVVFIGDSAVGKSSIIQMFVTGVFSENVKSTVGIDFRVKALEFNGTSAVLQIWDTAGQERYRAITNSYFRKADAVVVAYDAFAEATFLNLRSWMQNVEDGCSPDTVLLFLANKQDLADTMTKDNKPRILAVDNTTGQKLAKSYGALFFPVSAKTGSGITEAFVEMAKNLKEREDYVINNPIPVLAELKQKKKPCCGS